MATHETLVVETVFANQAYLRLMERAKAVGYGVRLLFFGLQTAEQSIARDHAREPGWPSCAGSGHTPPLAACASNLTRAVAIADSVAVYASHVDGQPPRLVASAKAGRVTIFDRDTLPLVTAALDAAG